MTISENAWSKYIDALRKLNNEAARRVMERLESLGDLSALSYDVRQAFLQWTYDIVKLYGAGASTLAAEMYDALAELSNVVLPAAEPAALASFAEVAKTVNGALKSGNPSLAGQAAGRLVKQAGVDTTMKNAIRDGAEWAWIPHGDTCAYCIMLASNGWQKASEKALKGGHAEHIHANCDCTYAVRFDQNTNVKGYRPERYLKMYQNAPGDNWQDKLNAMRRDYYDEHADEINAQKRDAYAKRKEREEEADV